MSGYGYNVRDYSEIPVDEKKGWTLVFSSNGQTIGFKNPQVASVVLKAMFEGDKYLYDFPVIEDGPQDGEGIATPSVMVVPIFKTSSGKLLTLSVLEYRPVVRDPNTKKLGVLIQGLPGGRAKKVDQDWKEIANFEAYEEAGAKLKKLVLMGASSPDRALYSCCVRYAIAFLDLKKKAKPENFESILGTKLIPLIDFPLGLDGMVNTAIAFAWRYCGLVREELT